MLVKRYKTTLLASLIILIESLFHREIVKFLVFISNRTLLDYIIIAFFVSFVFIIIFNNYSKKLRISLYDYLFSILIIIFFIYTNPRIITRLKFLLFFIFGYFSQKDKNKISKIFHFFLLMSIVVLWEFFFTMRLSGRILLGSILQDMILVLSALVLYNNKEKLKKY